MLSKINALPRSEDQAPFINRDRELRRGQGCENVSRHVVGPFVVMAKKRIAVRNQVWEKSIEAALNVGMRIFLK